MAPPHPLTGAWSERENPYQPVVSRQGFGVPGVVSPAVRAMASPCPQLDSARAREKA
jgi:hypothetical protein